MIYEKGMHDLRKLRYVRNEMLQEEKKVAKKEEKGEILIDTRGRV